MSAVVQMYEAEIEQLREARAASQREVVIRDGSIVQLQAMVRQLQSRLEAAEESLQRIGEMSVRFNCTCGRPTGTGAIKSCADRALAALADTKHPAGRVTNE